MPKLNSYDKKHVVRRAKIDFPQDMENLSFVLYSQPKAGDQKEVLYVRPIEKIRSPKYDTDFYAVKSSKYGIRINPEATHWCIAVLGANPKVLFESRIPEEMTNQIIDYTKDKAVYFNRFSKNCKFTIGMSKAAFNRAKPAIKAKKKTKKHQLISGLINS